MKRRPSRSPSSFSTLQCQLVAALALVLLTAPADAQINTERLRLGAEESGYSGHFDLSLALRDGNTDVFSIGTGFHLQHAVLEVPPTPEDAHASEQAVATAAAGTPSGADALPEEAVEEEMEAADADPYTKRLIFLASNYSFSEENQERSVNDGFAHLRWVRKTRPDFGVETFVQYQFNEFLRLDTRYLVGAGLRFGLLIQKQREIFAGTGYMYEYEKLDSEEVRSGEELESRNHRWTNYLSFKMGSADQRLSLVSTTYFQIKIDEVEDFRILEEAEFQVKLTERARLGLSLSVLHDNQPPLGVEETDLRLLNRIRYTF
ncbi:MAG: DUF481 domain-containing protein [Acidobacteriota bacterium]|nr:DUF481 domain-containing protein [Acidobacteriota bacterium]